MLYSYLPFRLFWPFVIFPKCQLIVMVCCFCAILCSINDLLHLSHILDRRRQILITRFRNQNIVLNPNTSDTPVPVQHIKVDVLRVHRILQVRLNNEAAKVDLDASVSGSFRYKKTDSLQARQ
jgi:hypothetical protein